MNSVPMSSNARRVRGRVAILLLLTGGVAGCQSYERKPLDLTAHQAAILARTPESTELRAFARALSEGAGEEGADARTFDLADGVSRDEAEAVAMVFNAELRVARLRAGVAQASAANAGLWEDPSIGVDLTRIIQSVAHPWKVMASVGLTIPVSGRLEIEKQRAGAEHAVELARVAQEEWAVRMDLRRAWVRWSALEAQITTTREFLVRADDVVSIVDRMEQAGEMARTEARLFRIERSSRSVELASLEARLNEEEIGVRRLMGLSPAAPLRLVSSGVSAPEMAGGEGALTLLTRELGSSVVLDTPPTPTSTPPSGTGIPPTAASSLAAVPPLLLTAMAEYELAERGLELEVRKQYPDVTIGPGYGREDGDDEVLLGVSVPLPILNANRRGIAEARARREVARGEAEAAVERLIGELHVADAQRRAAGRQRELMEQEIIPMVDAQYEDARRVAQLGEVNTLVLVESLSRQQDTKMKLIEARREEALAAIRMHEIVGPGRVETSGEPGATLEKGDKR